MLVLTRRINQKILLPTVQVSVQVVAVKSGGVRLGIEAPPGVTILREEVQDRTAEWGAASMATAGEPSAPDFRRLNQLLRNRLNIDGLGLAELRRQLEAGLAQDALATLAKVEEDVLMLRERMEAEVERASRPPGSRARKALLVEDDSNERELLAGFLRTAGLDVDTAGDGADALDYLHSHGRPDVVLLDMGLPRCDGATMVRQLRRDPAYAGLKIFAVSGSLPGQFDLDRGPKGVDRWFHKPINPEAFLQDLQRELDGSLSPL